MNRHSLRGGLAASLAAVLVLPIVLAVTLGAAALLAAVGDAGAAAVLRWVALGLGVLWAASVVVTAAVSATVTLACGGRPRHGGRRQRRRWRRFRDEAGRDMPGPD